MATDPEFIDEWRRFTEEVRGHFLATSKSSQAEKELMVKTSLNLGDLLSDPNFPQDVKQTILRKARTLLDIDAIVDDPSLARTLSGSPVSSVARLADDDILQFVPGRLPAGSAKSQILSGLSLSVDKSKATLAEGPGSALRLSKNLPSVEWLEQTMASQDALNGLSPGNKILIFDTETAGLSTKLAGVHDVGYSVMHVMKTEEVSEQSILTKRNVSGYNRDRKTARYLAGKEQAQLAVPYDPQIRPYGSPVGPMSYKYKVTDPLLESVVVHGDSASFSIPRLEYGKIYNGSGFQSINDFLQRPGIAGAGDGEDFIKGIYPMLKEMQGADIIAGQNVRFDISQVIQNAMRTAAYQSGTFEYGGENVKALIDDIWDNKISVPGKVLDTRELLSNYYRFDEKGLSVAPELLLRGEKRPKSLENVVLSSNIVDLMERDGVDVEQFFLSGTKQHSAAFDNRLTGFLLKYMIEGSLDVSDSGGLGLGDDASAVSRRIRYKTLSSYAYTPVSNIGDVTDIDPKLFARMVEGGEVRVGIMGQADSYGLNDIGETFGKSADEIYAMMADDTNDLFMVGKVTPMEQGIWASRKISSNILQNAGAPTATVDQVLTRSNIWQYLSGMAQPGVGKMLSGTSKLLKQGGMLTDAEFQTVQSAWAKVGMPFAGISREERILTGAIGHASTLSSTVSGKINASVSNKILSDIAPDLGILRFAEQEKAHIGGSGKISMPMEILEAAAESDPRLAALKFGSQSEVDDMGVRFLNFSVTDQPAYEGGRKLFNVGVSVDTEQAQALSEWLRNASDDTMIGDRTLASFGLDSSMRATILDDIMESGPKWGINIGFLDDDAADYAATAVDDLLQSLVRDTDRVGFAMPFLGREDGILKTGAMMLNRFMNDEDVAAVGDDLRRAEAMALDVQLGVVEQPSVRRVMKEYQERVAAMVQDQMNRKAKAPKVTVSPDVDASSANLSGAIDDAEEVAARAVGDRAESVLNATQSAWDNSTKFVDVYMDLTRKKLPIVGAAIAGLFIGAAVWKKDKEEDYYGAPLESAGYESQPINNSPAAQEVAMGTEMYGYGMPPQRKDYLATAGVAFNQYNNRINHTSMGTNKYDDLYNGAY